MVRFKSRTSSPGFMMMEVMLTIALVGMALAPMFALQTSAMRSLYRYSVRWQLILPLKNRLIDEFTKMAPQEKKDARITYKKSKVSDRSAFKEIKDLYKQEVASKPVRGRQESIISFIYQPGGKES